MARSRYQIYENNCPHFLTCTIVNWIPLFTRPDTVKILFDSLDFLQQEQRLSVYGYVVLENHLHLVAQAKDLQKEIQCFKSYTAKMLIRYLEEHKVTRILEQLAFQKLAFKKDRQYQVWQEGSHPQLLQNDIMLRQKLDYIHNNPVKRGYVDEPVHWRYSSARNYAGREGLLPVFRAW
jgi:REP element-mobilizing transposase RayT